MTTPYLFCAPGVNSIEIEIEIEIGIGIGIEIEIEIGIGIGIKITPYYLTIPSIYNIIY